MLIILILLIIFNFCDNSFDRKDLISKRIETNINNCYILTEKDTHGGFLGDGDYFAKIKCNKTIDVSNWNKLPLSENIYNNMKMEWCYSHKCLDAFSRFDIPELDKGYYFFNDRNSESTNKYDDTNLNNRSSYNYSVAIYDYSNNIIYYYELDT